jgi:GAF domain-containing protein
VATTGVTANIPDAYKDARFNRAMDKETGFRTRAILCMAIKNSAQEVCGVLQVMNKLSPTGVPGTDAKFNTEDEQMLRAFCAQAAVAIENSKLFTQTEAALNHALSDQRNLKFMLSVTKNLFSDMHLTSMIDQMTMQVHHLLKADDCALYLVDDKSHQFWLAKEESGGSTDSNMHKHAFNVGIVGAVAASGDTVRISTEAHRDPRFSPLVDQRKGKTTHSILCCPIISESVDGTRRIVGVISVRDEKDRGGFEAEEEKLLKVFCAQAAVAITNSKRFSSIMEGQELKESDHSAADYLKKNRGMQLADDDIAHYSYSMQDIQLKGAIGNGSYGEVYRAQVGGAIVAVKKLHVRNLKAEQVDAFCKEASLMCQLKHTNIVGFIGAVTEPSNLAIITQFCSRGSLADLLLTHSVDMNFKLKLKFAIDAARGMIYLHGQRRAHRHSAPHRCVTRTGGGRKCASVRPVRVSDLLCASSLFLLRVFVLRRVCRIQPGHLAPRPQKRQFARHARLDCQGQTKLKRHTASSAGFAHATVIS